MTQDRVSKSKIPEALDALRALGAKELDDVSARDAIRKMRRQIERVLRLGYSYSEVSTTLASLDIHISGERIKYLLNDIRKKTRKKSKSSLGDTRGSEIDNNIRAEVEEMPVSSNPTETAQTNGKSSRNGQPQSKVTQPNKANSTDKRSLATNNNTDANNTNSLAFKPQLINDEDL
ncbi:hypothetical protein DSM106972_093030 [Dulcicalothrix desertica PCC 7102]|uniref:Uncharacterized protein n=1 Tax=Dulcicalothrix desertica PCC 7102 TaxID=232991 RepID=A0A433ULD0_9CYAN|nr:hypothetical protein [Dulcicalothrix desertica]RUS94666.1 hypothetical protein DSM106972_093030 [Dulcicalothrix desertica PCC 7102]TWH62558.1 hypothetical protein CAL7102_00049 [Dulcicalothrix desertica PCC 7102]